MDRDGSWDDMPHSPNKGFLREDDGIISGELSDRTAPVTETLLPEGARQGPCPQPEGHRRSVSGIYRSSARAANAIERELLVRQPPDISLRDGRHFNFFRGDQGRNIPTPASENVSGTILRGEREAGREIFPRVQRLLDQRW